MHHRRHDREAPRAIRFGLSSLAALAGALAGPAGAATPELETIQVTATRRAEPAFEVPNATTIATLGDIRAAAPQTVMDALRRQPGMYVQQTTPGQGIVILRGLKGSEVLQVVDGFRLNNAIFRNAPNQYVALVDSQSLARIEAVRGPMSGLYGGDAMGGVVQMLSWEPRFDTQDWSGEGLLRTTYGTADDSTLTRLQAATGRRGFAIGGGFTYQDVKERRVGGGEKLPYTSYSARAADLKVSGAVATGHELTLSVQYAEQPRTPRYDELTPGYGQTQPNSAVYWFSPQRRDLLQLRWRGSEPNALWETAELHVGRQAMRDDRETRDYGSSNLDTERNLDVTSGLTFQATRTWRDAHHVTWGGDWYEDDIEASRDRTNIVTGVTSERAPRFPDGSTMSQWGVFLADDWSVNARMDVLASLRLNQASTDLPASGSSAAVAVDDTGWSGNLSLAYKLNDDWRVVTNLGRGFRAPNVFDLGTFGDRPGGRFNLPNPDLAPETVTTLDAGVKWSTDRLTGELIGYYSWYRDKITSVLTGEVTPSGRLVVQSQNAASLDLYGAEFALRAQLTNMIELHGTLTWTVGNETLADDVYPADRIPPLNGSAGVLWRPRPAVTLDAYAAFAGMQDRYSPRDEVDPRLQPGGTPGWTTWNIRLGWEPAQRVSTSLQLANLADHRYREFGSGLDAPGFGCSAMIELRF
ncbi:MAG TPA: TonB-dependent receptor [Steroidobacteraceae bacterium]